MKAYVVLAGGGVKGAALAGCVAAAEHQQIEFAGFAGTSAGAIVAMLAAVGYRGHQLRELMLGAFHPKNLLDDDGTELERTAAWVKECVAIMASDASGPKKGWQLLRAARPSAELRRRLLKDCGIYTGDRLSRAILDVLRSSPQLRGRGSFSDISFAELQATGCPPLKVVASDITSGRAAMFSAEDMSYGESVIQAVRASVAYPFVFKPVGLIGGRRLSDGGLASNLPSFLFAQDHEVTQYPILSFDLVQPMSEHPSEEPLVGFSRELLTTALSASDALFVQYTQGVHYITVPIPVTVSTLGFADTNDDQLIAMYDAGHRATTESLSSFEPLVVSRQAGDKLQKQLQSRYGDPKLFTPALWALATMIQEKTAARGVRTHIMLPTGRPDGSRIVTYHYGFRDTDGDSDLELAEFGGCSGRALENQQPVVADLVDARDTFESWRMTREQQARVAPDRAAMLSVPIFAWSRRRQTGTPGPVLGVLSVDSSTQLTDTRWVERTEGENPSVLVGIVQVMRTWADIISKLLR